MTLLAVVAGLKIDTNRKYILESFNFAMLSWFLLKCALKITGIELETLADINLLDNYENCVRGGITRVIRHYAEANIKYMYDYDKSKKRTNMKC